MPDCEPFTFGIALIPRAAAHNWPLIETLLDLTLTSVCAQTDPDFRVVIAGHDRPRIIPDDRRFTFVEVDWPAQEPGPDNADSGRKNTPSTRWFWRAAAACSCCSTPTTGYTCASSRRPGR
jgi:hypothetical protein